MDHAAGKCEAENKMRKVGCSYLPLIRNFNHLNAIFSRLGSLETGLQGSFGKSQKNPSEILNSDFNVVPDFVFFFFFLRL